MKSKLKTLKIILFKKFAMDSNTHITILNLLSREDLISISSILLNENVALKTRLQDLESQVSVVINAFKDFQVPQASAPEPEPVQQPEDDLNSRKLFVRNISFRANKEDLYAIFSRYGRVEHAKILYETNQYGFEQSRGFGFVIFDDAADAQKALEDKYITIDGRVAECHLAVNGKDTRPANKHTKH